MVGHLTLDQAILVRIQAPEPINYFRKYNMEPKTIKLNIPPEILACQYLKCEFRKIFSDVKNKEFWEKIDHSLDGFKNRETDWNFWHLLAAISEGWKLKSVFRLLTNKGYKWDLVEFPISKITLGSMSAEIDLYLEKCNWNPAKFKKAWETDRKMRQVILNTGFSQHKERDHFPIMLFHDKDKFKVFDGMRRTLLKLISGEEMIKAYLGYEINPEAKSLLSQDRAYLPLRIFRYSQTKDKELRKAVIRMGQEMVRLYRNGREIFTHLKTISHNQEIKNLIDEILAPFS